MKPMMRAIELSREMMESNQGGPFGAVIVKDREIIAEGWNKVTSTNDPTAHAEMVAIRNACEKLGTFDLKGCELYSSCEPCPMCLAAIYWARLDKVYYGNTRQDAAKIDFDDDHIYQEISVDLDKRQIPMTQLSHEEAHEVFEEWAAKEDRIQY